jgi:hydrogenase 3 maturation protease
MSANTEDPPLSRFKHMLDDSLLSEMLKGRVVIACVGNELRADDGAGPLVAGMIRETPDLKVVNCGETPENYLGVIIREKPDKIVVIDAVYMGAEAGEVRAIRKEDLAEGGYSTHMPTLSLFTDFVESQTDASTYFIGIEPATIAFGGKMTPKVEKASRELAGRINALAGRGRSG